MQASTSDLPNSIDVGMHHSCMIAAEGTYCWGENVYGQLGVGDTSLRSIPTMVFLTDQETEFSEISCGDFHTLAIHIDSGSFFGWGNNGHAEMGGDPGQSTFEAPEEVSLGSFSAISAGMNHSCVVSGTHLKCWGRAASGQLGDGQAFPVDKSYAEAVAVDFYSGGLPHSVSCGGDHTCAITQDGRLWCWGGNTDGQLGNPSASDTQNTPLEIQYP